MIGVKNLFTLLSKTLFFLLDHLANIFTQRLYEFFEWILLLDAFLDKFIFYRISIWAIQYVILFYVYFMVSWPVLIWLAWGLQFLLPDAFLKTKFRYILQNFLHWICWFQLVFLFFLFRRSAFTLLLYLFLSLFLFRKETYIIHQPFSIAHFHLQILLHLLLCQRN